VRVVCTLTDRNRMPVADGTWIRMTGAGLDTSVSTERGRGYAFAVLPARAESSVVRLTAGKLSGSLHLRREEGSTAWHGGCVRGADDQRPLPGVTVCSLDNAGREGTPDTTSGDGRFNLLLERERLVALLFRRDGFSPDTIPAAVVPVDGPINAMMRPVAERRLFQKTYLLDARYGGLERGTMDSAGLSGADVNLEIALRAAALLRAAGANPVLVRSSDSTIAED